MCLSSTESLNIASCMRGWPTVPGKWLAFTLCFGARATLILCCWLEKKSHVRWKNSSKLMTQVKLTNSAAQLLAIRLSMGFDWALALALWLDGLYVRVFFGWDTWVSHVSLLCLEILASPFSLLWQEMMASLFSFRLQGLMPRPCHRPCHRLQEPWVPLQPAWLCTSQLCSMLLNPTSVAGTLQPKHLAVMVVILQLRSRGRWWTQEFRRKCRL